MPIAIFLLVLQRKTIIIKDMATTADLKNGMCIEFNGKTMLVVEFQHVKPGKGPAFVRTKLKNIENGRTIDNTFTAGEKIEPVRVERRPYQYLYEDDMGCNFMHTETFEQIVIDKNLIDNSDLMKEGQVVEVMFHTEKEAVLTAELPPHSRYGGDLYRARRQRRHRFVECSQARHRGDRRHSQGTPFHQHRRQDTRRHPHTRILRTYQIGSPDHLLKESAIHRHLS